MKDKNKFKFRRNFLIYPTFQLKLLGANIAILSCGYVLAGLLVSGAFRQLRESGVQAGISPDHIFFKFIDHQAGMVYVALGAALVMAIVTSGALSLYLSHRLAGPIVRLRNYFTRIEANQGSVPAPVSFRKGDFFLDLPPAINGAISELVKKQGAHDISDKKAS